MRPSSPGALALVAAVAATLTAGGSAPARAADSSVPWCSVDPVDRFQYLRRLSLDLRQRAPSADEYDALVAQDDVPADLVDTLLNGPDFKELVRAYHEDLLWPNVKGALMFNAVTQLGTGGDPRGRLSISADERSLIYRGAPAGRACADRPQTEFEPDGTPIPGPDGLDGWVEVEPYWEPGTRVRVCAFEAQDKLVAHEKVNGQDVARPCNVTAAVATKRCGCGPKLSFCNFGNTRNMIRDAVVEQMLRLVDGVVLEDRPYTEVLTTRQMEVNGPVSHYLRWQWGFAADVFMTPDRNFDVPEVPFTETKTWKAVERGPAHAGLLTLPAYLLKFQTNRSRAHRFHNAFLCQPFEPPPGGLQLAATSEPDVAKRPGCSYCHQTLEPAAAYWGRFSEQGASWLDPALYPTVNERCRQRDWANDPLLRWACRRVYISEREPLGVLRAYEFARDGSPEAEQLARHADQGPRAFAQVAIDDGRFASCTTRKWWRQLLRRDPTLEEEETLLPQLARDFQKNGYRLKGLIKAIVTHPAYRRAQ